MPVLSKVSQGYVWKIDADAMSTLLDLPFRCTDVEIAEENGRKVIICHGIDTGSNSALVEAGTSEKPVVLAQTIGVRLTMPTGQVFDTRALVWAERPTDQSPRQDAPQQENGEQNPTEAAARVASSEGSESS